MKTIIFIYGHNKYMIEDEENNLKAILKKYSSIINQDLKDLLFLNKGKILSLNSIEQVYKYKKNKIITLFVLLIKANKKAENKELKDVICSECNNLTKMKINEDKISLKNCVNKHKILDLNINEFINSQLNKEPDMKCHECTNNINLYNNFFICSCNNLICPLCAEKHNKNHYMIKYNERFYKCFPHGLKFVSYCKSCNINLCEKCEEKHTGKEHTRISYKAIMPNPKKLIEINDEIKEVKEKLKRYKFEINRLNNLYITNMNNVIDDINKYILLYNYLQKIVGNLNNYERIKNIKSFKKKKFIKEIEEFLNDNINNKFKKLIDIIDSTKKSSYFFIC